MGRGIVLLHPPPHTHVRQLKCVFSLFSCGHATLYEVPWSVKLELNTQKTRIYDTAVLIVWVCEFMAGVVGVGLG